MVQYKTRSTVTVDFTKLPALVGRVVEKKVIPEDKHKRRMMVIDTGVSLCRVFESTGLKEAFDAAVKGDGISLIYLGLITLKKSGNRFKNFNAKVFDLKPDDPIPAEVLDEVRGALARAVAAPAVEPYDPLVK